MAQIEDEIAKATIRFLLKEPFYGHFFSGLLRSVSNRIPTMAVGSEDNSMILYINPEFWKELTLDHRNGVLKHKILHLVLKHVFRINDFKHKRLSNIAADLVVNQYIDPKQLPEGGMTLSMFSELKLDRNQTVNYYYNKLLDFFQENKPFSSNKNSEDQGSGTKNSEDQGSGSKNSEDQESENEDNLSNKEKLYRQLVSCLEEDHQEQQKHQLWDKFKKSGSASQRIVEDAIDRSLQNAIEKTNVKDFGNLPSDLQIYLKEFEYSRKPKVNWKRILRMFGETARRTYVRNTLRRPSKRYGTTPGTKICNQQKLLIAIDTSGSVDIDELTEFFQEVYHIHRRGAEIFVVECDTEITRSYLFKGDIPQDVEGGGGTNFTPPIRYANEKVRVDAIIYFTDGYAPPPSDPCRCPILWIISSEGITEGDEYWKKLPERITKIQKEQSIN
ncbi:MAG: putative metal-dependent peptidase [bacterium]|jgi:predicted metal-dependent peptidase